MAKKTTRKNARAQFIAVKFSKFTLVLMNARETSGHDDSLPFNADFSIVDENRAVLINGTAWNDGWGGLTELDYDSDKRQLFEEVNEACLKAFSHECTEGGKTFTVEIELECLVSEMAYLSICHPQNNGKIFSENAMVEFLMRP